MKYSTGKSNNIVEKLQTKQPKTMYKLIIKLNIDG